MDKFAEKLHDYRVFPRFFGTFYLYLLYDVVQWFKHLSDPTTQQVVLLTAFTSLLVPMYGFYTNTTSGVTKK
jgi:hypothetical protein